MSTSELQPPSETAFSSAVSDRICKHMNDDHAEAVLLYARHFGQVAAAESAVLESIDATGMNLRAIVAGETQSLRIPFAQSLADAKEAHVVLVEMVKVAQSQT